MRKCLSPLVLSVLLVLLVPLVAGCDRLTPEAAAAVAGIEAKAQAAKQALQAAADRFLVLKAEYGAIKARVDAGEALPAVLVTRFAELAPLVIGAASDVTAAEKAVGELLAARAAAAAAGVPWYWQIPWEGVAGVALGVLGLYFPVVRPLQGSAQAIIRGVRAANTADPVAGQVVKDAVCAEARALGVEAAVDALVQRFDPPAPEPRTPNPEPQRN